MKQDSIMMDFFERYNDYISISCFVQQFEISKMQTKNSNWLQSKNDGKHRPRVKFSYVVTIFSSVE